MDMQKAQLLMATKPNELAVFLEKRRRMLKLSRADLAERLTQNGYECTEGAINHWEHGRANVPIEDPVFARALAVSLDVPPSELIKASGVLDVSPDLIDNILARFSPLTLRLLKEASPKEIKKVEALIRTLLAENE